MRLRLTLFFVIALGLLFCGSAAAQVGYGCWDESCRDGVIDNNLHWGAGSQQGYSAQYYNNGYNQQYQQVYQQQYYQGGYPQQQVQCIRYPCGPQPMNYGCNPGSFAYQAGCYNQPPIVQGYPPQRYGGSYYGNGGYDPWRQYVAQLQRYCGQVARGNGRVFNACMQQNMQRAQSQRRGQQIGYAIGTLIGAVAHIHYRGCGH